MSHFFAAYIDPAGNGNTIWQYMPNPLDSDHPYLPILPEEAVALNQGTTGWPGAGHIVVKPRGTSPDLQPLN